MQNCMLCVQSESMGLLGGGAEPVEMWVLGPVWMGMKMSMQSLARWLLSM